MKKQIRMPRKYLEYEALFDLVEIGVPMQVEWTSMPNAPMANFEFSFEMMGQPRPFEVEWALREYVEKIVAVERLLEVGFYRDGAKACPICVDQKNRGFLDC